MAKNRKYENVYQIKVSGNCTNGFTSMLIHKLLMSVVEAVQYSYKAHDISIEVVSTKGDFNAVTGETKED
jgi:hypothetical protein